MESDVCDCLVGTELGDSSLACCRSVYNEISRSTQPAALSRRGNEYVCFLLLSFFLF